MYSWATSSVRNPLVTTVHPGLLRKPARPSGPPYRGAIFLSKACTVISFLTLVWVQCVALSFSAVSASHWLGCKFLNWRLIWAHLAVALLCQDSHTVLHDEGPERAVPIVCAQRCFQEPQADGAGHFLLCIHQND